MAPAIRFCSYVRVPNKRAIKQRHSYSPSSRPRWRGNIHEARSFTSPGEYTCRAGQCHSRASCVKCHLRCHAIAGTNPGQM